MLFFSDFPKKRKITYAVLAMVLAVTGLWLEGRGNTPRMGLIEVAEVVSCGATAQHSYLTNYNISYCLQNNSSDATVKRLGLRFTATNCIGDQCTELETVERELQLEIGPQATANATENISFERVEKEISDINWSVDVVSVKATR